MAINMKSAVLLTLVIMASIITVALGATAGLRAETTPALQGVWRAVEVVTTGPGAAVLKPPAAESNLVIFSGRHYSRTEVHSDQPRPVLTDWKNATAEQLRAAWGSFVAEAGTFEVSGDLITLRPAVAKNPAATGAFTVQSFQIKDNMLEVTLVRNQSGTIPNPPTITLARIQ